MTIKEMADKYCEGSSFEDAVMEKPAFISGANRVLEKIEQVIKEGFPWGERGYLLYNNLNEKIKELKGE